MYPTWVPYSASLASHSCTLHPYAAIKRANIKNAIIFSFWVLHTGVIKYFEL